jgi:hypothetical protein
MLHGTAATVVLLRDAPDGLQVLLLERPGHRGAFAGAWVFPGGVVDPQDAVEATANDDAGLACGKRRRKPAWSWTRGNWCICPAGFRRPKRRAAGKLSSS